MEKTRELFLGIIERYYYFYTDRLLTRQDNLFRTYLWVAALILSSNLWLLEHGLRRPALFYSLVSLILAFVAVIICLNALRSRPGEVRHFPAMLEYFNRLGKYKTSSIVNQLVGQLWSFIQEERGKQNLRGRKLRATSNILVFAFFALALAGIMSAATRPPLYHGPVYQQSGGREQPPEPPPEPEPDDNSEFSE